LFAWPLTLLAPPTCAACEVPLTRDAVFCAGCLATLEEPPPLPASLSAGYAFGGAVAEVLHRAKYSRRAELLRPLSRLVCERLPKQRFDAVIPMLAHRERLRTRGFDLATLLAVAVAQHIDAPLRTDVLTRSRAVRPLVGLDAKARREAIAGAFHARARSAVGLASVLLVDDVHTTGATFADAARALAAIGVGAHLHVLAATPALAESWKSTHAAAGEQQSQDDSSPSARDDLG
jgi:predicted amidophosphoribosyltransferase